MAKSGKILALLGGILVVIGTFGLSLYSDSGNFYYGIGYFFPFSNFTSLFTGGWVAILIAVGIIFYLLAFILILIGMKSRIFAIIGSLFPLAMATFVFLFAFGVWPNGLLAAWPAGDFLPLVAQWVPMSFPQTVLFGGVDLGTWVIAVGGLLALISGFISRED